MWGDGGENSKDGGKKTEYSCRKTVFHHYFQNFLKFHRDFHRMQKIDLNQIGNWKIYREQFSPNIA